MINWLSTRNHPNSRLPGINPTRTTDREGLEMQKPISEKEVNKWEKTIITETQIIHNKGAPVLTQLKMLRHLSSPKELGWNGAGGYAEVTSTGSFLHSQMCNDDLMSRCWCLRCFWWTLRAWCLTCKTCGVKSKSFCCLVKHWLCSKVGCLSVTDYGKLYLAIGLLCIFSFLYFDLVMVRSVPSPW